VAAAALAQVVAGVAADLLVGVGPLQARLAARRRWLAARRRLALIDGPRTAARLAQALGDVRLVERLLAVGRAAEVGAQVVVEDVVAGPTVDVVEARAARDDVVARA